MSAEMSVSGMTVKPIIAKREETQQKGAQCGLEGPPKLGFCKRLIKAGVLGKTKDDRV